MRCYGILLIALVGSTLACNPGREADGDKTAHCFRHFSQTFPALSGNRNVEGSFTKPGQALDIPLNGIPMWVAGLALEDRQFWAVALETGDVEAIEIRNQQIIDHRRRWGKVSPGAPPVLGISCKGDAVLVNELVEDVARYGAPVPLPNGRLAYISDTGDVIVQGPGGTKALDVRAMHDSRILLDEKHRMLVLTHPRAYQHQVLGDNIEARGMAIIETTPEIKVVSTFLAPDSSVIEGIGAIWEDLDGDGKKEIATTLSNNSEGVGGKHVIFNEGGEVLASGQPVRPDGWRHLLMSLKSPDSERSLLAAIQRPHVDRVLNIYEWKDQRLEVVAARTGFSTHAAGSRNLDAALGLHITGSDHQYFLLPCTSHDTLHAISYDYQALRIEQSLALGGKISTNIACISLDKSITFGVGTDKKTLKLWL